MINNTFRCRLVSLAFRRLKFAVPNDFRVLLVIGKRVAILFAAAAARAFVAARDAVLFNVML